MINHRFENPRAIIRTGYVAIGIALIFNFVGRRLLTGIASEDAIDALAGVLHGVAFGLLGLGIWRFNRSRAGRAPRGH